VLCFTFIFPFSTSIHEVCLARLMKFRTEFAIQIGAMTLRSIVAVTLAWLGFGVWSMVAGSLTGVAGTAALLVIAVPYFPRLRFHPAYLAEIWKISGSYMGDTILYYINTNFDLLLIGRRLGAHALGCYQNARSLTDEVRGRLAMPLQRVLFPAFSSIQADAERLHYSVRRSARLLAAVVCPVGFGLSAVAAEAVPVLYGPQWYEMIPALTMLGVAAALRASTAISSPIFNSQNRVGLLFRCDILGTLLLVGSIWLTLPYGLQAVAAAVAANALFSLVIFRLALSLIGLGTRDMLHILARPILASLVMWGAIALLRPALEPMNAHVTVRLAILVFSGAAVYTAALHAMSRQYLSDFMEVFRKLLGR